MELPMCRAISTAIAAFAALGLCLGGEDKTDSDSKRIASLAFKYVQRQQNADGSYGDSDSQMAIAHTALVTHALVSCSWRYRESDGPFISKAVEFLLKAQNDDGSFGSGNAKAGLTLLALRSLLALQNPAYDEHINRAIAFARQQIPAPKELHLAAIDLSACVKTAHELWRADAERAVWSSPKADIALLAVAWRLLRDADAISDGISIGFKHYVRLALLLSELSLPKNVALFQEAVQEIRAAQRQGGDADDGFGSIPGADAKALDGNLAVSTAMAGRAADFAKSHYKKALEALRASESKK